MCGEPKINIIAIVPCTNEWNGKKHGRKKGEWKKKRTPRDEKWSEALATNIIISFDRICHTLKYTSTNAVNEADEKFYLSHIIYLHQGIGVKKVMPEK